MEFNVVNDGNLDRIQAVVGCKYTKYELNSKYNNNKNNNYYA